MAIGPPKKSSLTKQILTTVATLKYTLASTWTSAIACIQNGPLERVLEFALDTNPSQVCVQGKLKTAYVERKHVSGLSEKEGAIRQMSRWQVAVARWALAGETGGR